MDDDVRILASASRHLGGLVLVALLAAPSASGCGGPASASEGAASASEEHGSGSESHASASGAAGHEEVCHAHDGSLDRPCAEGLFCCYPCGTDGCDSVCHTREECDADQMRPSAPPAP